MYFTDMGYRRDVIAAVVDKNSDNVIEALEKVKTLEEFAKRKNLKNYYQ